jgi:hypothetical protein
MAFINLTQHDATAEQIAAGIVDIHDVDMLREVRELLTFNDIPDMERIIQTAKNISYIASDYRYFYDGGHRDKCEGVMIGCAPYLMGPLEIALIDRAFKVFYADSVEVLVPGNILETLKEIDISYWIRTPYHPTP